MKKTKKIVVRKNWCKKINFLKKSKIFVVKQIGVKKLV